MADRDQLLEQLKIYQRQNKELLNENEKLYAKSKRLKLDKKELKAKLQSMKQKNKSNSSSERSIEHETLSFVQNHHIEMQRIIDALLLNPSIIQSETHKDLQYLSSKLSYVQSKISSNFHHTADPHPHAPPTLTNKGLQSATYHNILSHLNRNVPPKHRHNKVRNRSKRPNIRNLATQSQPFQSQRHRNRKGSKRRHSKQQRNNNNMRPLDISKYLNQIEQPERNRRHSCNTMIVHDDNSQIDIHDELMSNRNALVVPLNKERSTMISTSSMKVSRASFVDEDLTEIDVQIRCLPPLPNKDEFDERTVNTLKSSTVTPISMHKLKHAHDAMANNKVGLVWHQSSNRMHQQQQQQPRKRHKYNVSKMINYRNQSLHALNTSIPRTPIKQRTAVNAKKSESDKAGTHHIQVNSVIVNMSK